MSELPVASSPVASSPSVLAAPETAPVVARDAVPALGRVVVVAPHPDDESLGCGGLLAYLADLGQPTVVAFVTDGTRSHPNSRAYPAPRLRALREAEALAALAELGHAASVAHFLRYPDCAVPSADDAGAVARIAHALQTWRPDTLVLPWRRDPHCDHEDAWALFRAALAHVERAPRVLEYPVWAWTRPDGPEAPRAGEVRPWRLDIASVQHRKARAVAAHVSQTTRLIDDDPDGFVLLPNILRSFERPYELYFDA